MCLCVPVRSQMEADQHGYQDGCSTYLQDSNIFLCFKLWTLLLISTLRSSLSQLAVCILPCKSRMWLTWAPSLFSLPSPLTPSSSLWAAYSVLYAVANSPSLSLAPVSNRCRGCSISYQPPCDVSKLFITLPLGESERYSHQYSVLLSSTNQSPEVAPITGSQYCCFLNHSKLFVITRSLEPCCGIKIGYQNLIRLSFLSITHRPPDKNWFS